MVSTHSIPWYNAPAREYPAKRWLGERYPFYMPPALFARLVSSRPAGWCTSPPRDFPAKGWVAGQRAGG